MTDQSYNIITIVLAYFYIAGAFISWWILDKTVENRSWIAAGWAVCVPYLILVERLAPAGESDDPDDDNDFGV